MHLLSCLHLVVKQILAVACATVLASCGGGGHEVFDPVQDTAQGIWQGTSSTGLGVAVVILENGETWGVYTAGESGPIVGAIHADTASSDGRLGGHGKEFNIPSRTVTGFTYAGTYTPRNTITVDTSTGVRLSGSYRSSYLEPASISAIAGTFTGSAVTGSSPVQGITFTVSPTGSVTGSPSLGCSGSGFVRPRASRRNVFDVAITFSGASCALGNGATVTGIAYYDTETRRLIAMGMNGAQSDGFIAVALKQ